MKIPSTENALLIRTSFSDESAWQNLMSAASEPEDPFVFLMDIVNDIEADGATVEQVIGALPEDYSYSFIVIADEMAVSQPDYPLLVLDLLDKPRNQFRALATQVASIENNLSIGNMGFEEFAEFVDESGVFRGFPAM